MPEPLFATQGPDRQPRHFEEERPMQLEASKSSTALKLSAVQMFKAGLMFGIAFWVTNTILDIVAFKYKIMIAFPGLAKKLSWLEPLKDMF